MDWVIEIVTDVIYLLFFFFFLHIYECKLQLFVLAKRFENLS